MMERETTASPSPIPPKQARERKRENYLSAPSLNETDLSERADILAKLVTVS